MKNEKELKGVCSDRTDRGKEDRAEGNCCQCPGSIFLLDKAGRGKGTCRKSDA
jgi:hypothetical protein